MLRDEVRFGALRIPRFYERRTFRILPAFLCFLAALWLLSSLAVLPKPNDTTWFACLLCFRNVTGQGWETGHLWSLSLEEQFYAIWPTLFVLSRRFRALFISTAIGALTIYRVYFVHSHPQSVGGLYLRPELRMDTLLIGSLFAMGRCKWIQTAPVELLSAVLALWVPFAICINILRPFDTVVSALISGTLISRIARDPKCTGAKLLSRRALVALGVASYSLYLWQQLFLGPHLQWWSLPELTAVAAFSFFFIERPFLPQNRRGSSLQIRAISAA